MRDKILVLKTMEEIKNWAKKEGYNPEEIEVGFKYYLASGYQDVDSIEIEAAVPDEPDYAGEQLYNVYLW